MEDCSNLTFLLEMVFVIARGVIADALIQGNKILLERVTINFYWVFILQYIVLVRLLLLFLSAFEICFVTTNRRVSNNSFPTCNILNTFESFVGPPSYRGSCKITLVPLFVCLSVLQFKVLLRNGSLVPFIIFSTMADNWNI